MVWKYISQMADDWPVAVDQHERQAGSWSKVAGCELEGTREKRKRGRRRNEGEEETRENRKREKKKPGRRRIPERRVLLTAQMGWRHALRPERVVWVEQVL
jgi:hypothetical protein